MIKLRSLFAVVCTFLFVEGCGDADSAPTGESGGSVGSDPSGGASVGGGVDGPASTSDSDGPSLDEVLSCTDPAADLSPWIGPELGADGLPTRDESESFVAHATEVLLRPTMEAGVEFQERVEAIAAQALGTPGFLGFRTRIDASCGIARTMGIWSSEESMMGFVYSGAHLEAIARTAVLSMGGRTTHFGITRSDLPLEWNTAMERLADASPFQYGQ